MESAAVTVRIAATVSRGDLMERTALTERDVARQGTTPVISSVTSADLTEKVALTTTRDAHSEKVAHAEKDARSERTALTERVVLMERVVLTEKTVVRQAKEDRHADLVRIHVRDSNPAVRAAHLATERGRKLQARDRRDPARAVSTRIPTKESRE